MSGLKTNQEFRKRRHYRVRKKIKGTAERPRMAVFVSNLHMYVQFIDDAGERTLAAASTQSKGFSKVNGKNDSETAKALGAFAAEQAKAVGIEQVVFDRGGFAFRGRIKLLADAAREAGLKF
ncbi:MAG: 50S ribosomal protein L18 [Verrucomicrobia bacterium]|nr:50S ribosomal protein L18 [Kiritimatiellia bacterium]MCP5487366.1 50S ribosomal protein L18 [Verrucomicrobiota bacterium]